MTDVVLIVADITHADVLAALHAESFDAGWSASSFETTLATPGSYGFIALSSKNDEPLGFALFRAGGGESEVLTIATRPAQRGRGIAGALMKQGLDQARSVGADEMFLEVAEDNAPAIHLYSTLKFQETGRRKAYYARPDGSRTDAVMMMLRIRSR